MRNAPVVLASARPSVISTCWLCASGSARSTVNQLPNRARRAQRVEDVRLRRLPSNRREICAIALK